MSAKVSAERTPRDVAAEKPIRERQLAAYYKACEYIDECRVLEVGCGEGTGASLLARKACSVVALDYSIEALSAAQAGVDTSNVAFTLMKVPPIGFADMSFDAVVCFQIIEHFEHPEEPVKEIERVLRNSGLALFATVNKEETISDNPYHLHEFTAPEFDKLLRAHFDSVEMYGVFGDELFQRYWQKNRRWVDTFLRADIFGLSSRLPVGLKRRLFDIASRLMRARLNHGDPELCAGITHENFAFKRDEFAGCLDFFAVCRKKSG